MAQHVMDTNLAKGSTHELEGIRQINPTQAWQQVQAGSALLLDVREPDEYAHSRIPGVLLFPLSSIAQLTTTAPTAPYPLPVLAPGQTLIIHCRSGGRSQQFARAVHASGYTGAIANLNGGILAWQQQGLPTVS